MVQRPRGTEPTVILRSQFEFSTFGQRGRAGLVLSSGMQDFLQGKQIGPRDNHAGLAVRSGVVAKNVRGVDHGDAFDIELEAEARHSRICPQPHGFLADRADNLGGLLHVVVRLAVLDIGLRPFHSRTQANPEDAVKAPGKEGLWLRQN